MYALVQTGGKQYKVEQGNAIFVEKLNAEAGEKVVLDQVLLVADGENLKVGSPFLEGATVTATVDKQGKQSKIFVFKYKPKKASKSQKGHRQPFTKLTIDSINF